VDMLNRVVFVFHNVVGDEDVNSSEWEENNVFPPAPTVDGS